MAWNEPGNRGAAARCRSRRSSTGPGKTSLGPGEFVASLFLPARAAAAGRRLPALHPAHRDGHRRGRRRRQPDARRRRHAAPRRASPSAPSAPTVLLVEEAAEALVGTHARRRRARRAGRGRARAACKPIDDKRGTIDLPPPGRRRARPPRRRDRPRPRAREQLHEQDPRHHHHQRRRGRVPLRAGRDAARRAARRPGPDRHQGRLRHRRLRRLHGHARRPAGLLLPGARAPRPRARRSRPSRAWPRASELHPLQQKFLEHAALQCGICTPGFLVAAKALLERNPDPTETEVRYWLAGNLCRCTGYDKIVRAVLGRRRRNEAGDRDERSMRQARSTRRTSSRSSARGRPARRRRQGHRPRQLRRRHDRAGHALGTVLRSPHAHARIRRSTPRRPRRCRA